MTAVVIRGDARQLPLPDESVDLIVTSPPYWALRSYTDGGEHYAGQIGDEPTPGEYIANLLDCTAEWARVLKHTGSLFVVLGDKYAPRRKAGATAFGARDVNLVRTGTGAYVGPNPLGAIPGSVWEIATQPLRVPSHIAADHDAAFPPALVRRIVLGWSPVDGVVLDPFGGTGTTALVADVHGRHGISVDRSADYCRIARWRVADPRERARALGVAPPPVVSEEQAVLFDDVEVAS